MTARTSAAAALAAVTLAAPAVFADCPVSPGALALSAPDGSPYEASLRVVPDPIAVGRPFVAEVTVCGAGGAPPDRVEVDATMPKHRHGMNYLPEVAAVGPGRYEARGLLFHMPGLWRLEVALYHGGRPVRLSHDFLVE